jgi:secreted Zn-dependent insulinase-like peptidase
LEHRDALLDRLNLQAYVHGSALRADALSLLKAAEDKLGYRTFPAGETRKPRSRLLPRGQTFLYRERNTDPEDVNSAIQINFQICSKNGASGGTARRLR